MYTRVTSVRTRRDRSEWKIIVSLAVISLSPNAALCLITCYLVRDFGQSSLSCAGLESTTLYLTIIGFHIKDLGRTGRVCT